MARYLNQTGLQDYTTQLTAKYKTVFATKGEVGSPLVASTAAAMTDTSKVYVYVGSESGYTSGNWYYYNGSAWVSGGVYNSIAVETDTTLSVPGMPADAKAAGDAIGEVADALGQISEIAENILYVTKNIVQSHAGVTYDNGENDNTLLIYGTSGSSSQRFACFNGNDSFTVTGSATPPKNIEAGTYTVTFNGVVSGSLDLYYTASTYNAGVKLTNGQQIVVSTSGGCLFVLAKSNTNFGTVDNPSVLIVNLFEGTSSESTAIDVAARGEIKALKKVKYVATAGSDSNDGDTVNTPYATISKALVEGAATIFVKAGTYTEASVGELNTAYRYGGVKIICDNAILQITTGAGLQFRYANVEISGLTVDLSESPFATSYGIFALNCTGKLTDCTVFGAKGAGGFRLDGSKMTLTRCVAHDNAVDGFNGHTVNTGYETECTLVDCVAYNNGDDGASIHENGKMFVRGGQYYNNTQTGLAPHDQCYFEATNAYCHNNGKGIEAIKDSSGTGEGLVIGCILTNNTTYGLDVQNYKVSTLGNGYSGNGSGKTNAGTGATIVTYSAE